LLEKCKIAAFINPGHHDWWAIMQSYELSAWCQDCSNHSVSLHSGKKSSNHLTYTHQVSEIPKWRK